jgi:hypothetical protein
VPHEEQILCNTFFCKSSIFYKVDESKCCSFYLYYFLTELGYICFQQGSSRHSVQTPSVPTRASSVSTPGSVLEEARVRLHVAAVPKFLPCREKEFDNIYRFIEGKIHDGAGG